MTQLSQEQINVDLFDEVRRLKNNWQTLQRFLENTDKLPESDCIMLLDLMSDIDSGLIK